MEYRITTINLQTDVNKRRDRSRPMGPAKVSGVEYGEHGVAGSGQFRHQLPRGFRPLPRLENSKPKEGDRIVQHTRIRRE